jgi:hypothetical protein
MHSWEERREGEARCETDMIIPIDRIVARMWNTAQCTVLFVYCWGSTMRPPQPTVITADNPIRNYNPYMLQFQNTKSTLLAALSFRHNGKHTCQCLGNKKSFSWQGLYPAIPSSTHNRSIPVVRKNRSRTLFFPWISENLLIYGSKHIHILDCVSRTQMHRRRKDYSGHDNYIQKGREKT